MAGWRRGADRPFQQAGAAQPLGHGVHAAWVQAPADLQEVVRVFEITFRKVASEFPPARGGLACRSRRLREPYAAVRGQMDERGEVKIWAALWLRLI
jgi:hypothetical protein